MSNEKVIYRGIDGVFLNSKSLFCEYHDIIKSPYFFFLNLITENLDKFSGRVDTELLDGLDLESLCELYCGRKYQNVLMDIIHPSLKGKIPVSVLDEFINSEIERIELIVKRSPILAMGRVIQELIRDKKAGIVKNFFIYNRYPNKSIENDLMDIFDEDVKFLTGELEDVLKEVPDDSTYVFSDITNISVLAECNKLNYSSIMIPYDYSYNKNSEGEYLIKIDEYMKKYLFKLDFFNALEIDE